jgi:dTDP-4-dehydrorhamnose reductase
MALPAAGKGSASTLATEAWGADSAAADTLLLDLEYPERCREAALALRPDAILHAAALADTGTCEREPERSYRLNVLASEALAQAAAALGIPMLFCSTDLVFGGDKAPYAPGDPVAPLMVYGRHKAEAEQRVLTACPQAQVARLPLMYGHSALSGRGMVAELVARLRRGEGVSLFYDEYRSMADAADVAADLWKTLLQAPSGIYHLGGPERLSRYAFGVRVAGQHGLDASLILPVSQADVATGTPRPRDVSMVRSRLTGH